MRYLKTFESFADDDWKNIIESNENYSILQEAIENDPESSKLFDELVMKIQSTDIKMIEPLFHDFELGAELLGKELSTYRMESIQNIDTKQMAIQALKYIAGIGILSALVKLFYIAGRYAFENLDNLGVGAVAGGVLVVLLYLAVFGGRGKKSQSKDLMKKDDGFADYEEI